MASTVRGVFFDMDGVVIDSKSLWSNILDTVAASFSLDLSLLRKYDGLNLSTKEAMRRVLEDSGYRSSDMLGSLISEIDRLYASLMSEYTFMELGIREVLDMLSGKGVFMVLVSNSSRSQVDMVIGHYGLGDIFKAEVTADDVLCGKPDGEPYLKALTLSGLAPDETVVVEDSMTGVVSAGNAGLDCIMIAGPAVPADFKSVRCVCREKLYEILDKLTGDEKDN